ncbi:hypothetical protein ACFYW1_04505 [Streptomyces sp. NPDC002669]|uniref:hypothetical protein n=1 Tax=Streptomyces sp. NPDC002669 TaxID=3364658 RepID=UPI0036751975
MTIATTASALNGVSERSPLGDVKLRSVRSVRVYWPVTGETLAALGAGHTETLRDDAAFGSLLQVLRSSPCAGDFGVYSDVFEVCVGVEGFTTEPGARPAFGSVGDSSLSPTLTVTVHIDARTPDDEVSHVLGRILDAHPWEVPVVELSAPFDLVHRA